MIPALRKQFNSSFSPANYETFLRRMDEICGTHVQFRLSETPCFFSKSLLDRMAQDGQELIRLLVENPSYRAKSDVAIPAEFKVPNEAPHPMFVQVDFGLVRDPHVSESHGPTELGLRYVVRRRESALARELGTSAILL